jgi:hypothetical protein
VHVDDFRLLGSIEKTSPFVVVGPAASPITGQNPTFRLVKFGADGRLEDQATYDLKNLTAAGLGETPEWELEYDFRREWKLPELNAQSYAKLFQRVANSPEEAARWWLLYSTSSPAASSVTPSRYRQFYCVDKNLTAGAYNACVK